MQSSLNGRRVKNPLVRMLFGLIGLVVVLGLVAGLVIVALPLALAAVVLGGLAAAILPRLRVRRAAPPTASPPPRRSGNMKRVEPIEPPRTLG